MLTLAYNHPAIPAQERRLQQFMSITHPLLHSMRLPPATVILLTFNYKMYLTIN
ncbi:hypothetical protein [Photobacterium carnosum]|uniref:hypothetical protein n=1 Tax=Photobacterium carnosum TaxID=2023717 RepID=UPI001E5C17DC|nr:hypothetical protein [Photobacterium carnosum]MCD9499121.1 hypothetical protein [Photobacterium carnosum]